MVNRRNGHAGDVHGTPRHVDRQCGPSLHRRGTWPELRRGYLDSDDISGRERRRSADVRLVGPRVWTENLLPRLRGAVYADFILLRTRAYARDHAIEPCPAGPGGWRISPRFAGDFGGHIPSRKARVG